jgi:hypothetical protein
VANRSEEQSPFWTFDSRSLAIFRLCLGAITFFQSIIFFHLPELVYQSGTSTEAGVLLPYVGLWAAAVSSVPFAAGLFTRWSNLLTFVGLVLLQNGVPQVLQGGDVLLRLLLFWSLFLPLGEKWSLDAVFWRKGRLERPWTAMLATWALTLQICFVYWIAAALKSDPLWTKSGNALFYALNIEHFTAPVGLYLRQYPDLLRTVSLTIPWFEIFGPFLLFVPVWNGACRMLAVILFVTFHLIGMQLLLRIGPFPWVCAIAWLAFVPKFFCDWAETRFGRRINLPVANRREK